MIKFAEIGDAYRVMALLLLRPASVFLPRSWAMALADMAGAALAASPAGARMRQTIQAAFPDRSARVLAREWLARPFHDFVSATRIADGRDAPAAWDIHSVGAPAALFDPAQSLIIAGAHFSREAMACLYVPHLVPKKLATVIAQVEGGVGVRGLRLRMQLGTIATGIKRIRLGDVDIVEVGKPSIVTRLLRHLKQPGSVVIIAPDAAWPKGAPGGFDRAFAGFATRTFALGTARLARLSQRPIVTCVPFLDEDGRIVMEWGDLIPAPARDDEAADERLSNQILDTVERAVGRRPGQYVLPFGHERHWDSTRELWVENASRSAAPPAPRAQLAAH